MLGNEWFRQDLPSPPSGRLGRKPGPAQVLTVESSGVSEALLARDASVRFPAAIQIP